jgi:hypothetical protein
MSPTRVFQSATATLHRLRQGLIAGRTDASEAASILEKIAAELSSIREISEDPSERPALRSLLKDLQESTNRVNSLVASIKTFQISSMFPEPDPGGSYAPDGSISQQERNSRIDFQG